MKRFVNAARHIPGWPSFWRHYYDIKRPGRERAELTLPLRGGLVACVPAGLMSAFDEVFLRDVYGAALSPGWPRAPQVVDVGANAGFFCLRMFARYPSARVIAVEPLPANRALLERQRALNPGVELVVDGRAVAGRPGTMALHFDSRREYSVDASLAPPPGADASVQVEVTTLADLYRDHGLTRCDLLKLDCEGAEYDILERCPDEVYAATDRIVLEVHERPGRPQAVDELVRFLRAKGYRVRNRKDEIVTCRRD